MKTFGFKGDLHHQLGDEIKLETSSIREVWTALFALYPKFQKYFVEKSLSGTDYLFIDQDGVTFESFCMDVILPKQHYYIVPQFQGSAGVPGMGMLGAFGGNALMGYGMQKLTDKLTPKEESTGGPEYEIITTESHLYSRNENKVEQGTPIPLVYGQLRVGSLVINSNISNYDFDYKTAQIENVSQALSLPNVDSFNFLQEGKDLSRKFNLRGDNFDSSQNEGIGEYKGNFQDPSKNSPPAYRSDGSKQPSADQGNEAYNEGYAAAAGNGGNVQSYGPSTNKARTLSDSSANKSPGGKSSKPYLFPPKGSKDGNYRPQKPTEKCFILDGAPVGVATIGNRGSYKKLESIGIYRSLDLICEGPIAGFALPISEPSSYTIQDGVGFFSNDHGSVSLPLVAEYSSTVVNTNNAKFQDVAYHGESNTLRNQSDNSFTLSFEEAIVVNELGEEETVLIAGENYPANLNNWRITANAPQDSRGLSIKTSAPLNSQEVSTGGIDYGLVTIYTYDHAAGNPRRSLGDYPDSTKNLNMAFMGTETYNHSTAHISSNYLFQTLTHIYSKNVYDRMVGINLNIGELYQRTDLFNSNPLYPEPTTQWGPNQVTDIANVTTFNNEIIAFSRMGFNTFWYTSDNGSFINGDSENTSFAEAQSERSLFLSRENGDTLPAGVLERIKFSELSENDQYSISSGLGFQDLKNRDTEITLSPPSKPPKFVFSKSDISNAKRFVQAAALDYFALLGGSNDISFSSNSISDELLIENLETPEGEKRIPYLNKPWKDVVRIYADKTNNTRVDLNRTLRFFLRAYDIKFELRTETIDNLTFSQCKAVGGNWKGGFGRGPCSVTKLVQVQRYTYVDISFKKYSGLARVNLVNTGHIDSSSAMNLKDDAGVQLPSTAKNLYSFGYKNTSQEYRDVFVDAINLGSAELGNLLRHETFSERVFSAFANKMNHGISKVTLPRSTSVTSSGTSNHSPVWLNFVPGIGSDLSSDITSFLNTKGSSPAYMFEQANPLDQLGRAVNSSISFSGGVQDQATNSTLNRGFYIPDLLYRVEFLVLRKTRFGLSGTSTYSTLPTKIEGFARISSSGKVSSIFVARTTDNPVWDSQMGKYTPIIPAHIDGSLPFTTSTAQTGAFERYYQDIAIIAKIDSSNNGVNGTTFFVQGGLAPNKITASSLTNSNYSEYIQNEYALGFARHKVTRTAIAQGIFPDNMDTNDTTNDDVASFTLSETDFTMSNNQGGATINFETPPQTAGVIGLKCEKVNLNNSYFNRINSTRSTTFTDRAIKVGELENNEFFLAQKTFVETGDMITSILGLAAIVTSYDSETGKIAVNSVAFAKAVPNHSFNYVFIQRNKFPSKSSFYTGRITDVFVKSTGAGYRSSDGNIADGISVPMFFYSKYPTVQAVTVLNINGSNQGYVPNTSFFISLSIGGLSGLPPDPVRDLSCVCRVEVGETGSIVQIVVVDPGYTNAKKLNKIAFPINSTSFNRLLSSNDKEEIERYAFSTRDYYMTDFTHFIDPDVQSYKQDLKIKISKDSIDENGAIKFLDLIQYGFGFTSSFASDDFLSNATSSVSSQPQFLLSTNSEGKVTSLSFDEDGPIGSYSEADNPISVTLSAPPSESIDLPTNDPLNDSYAWARSIYLNGTPMRDKNGLFNFSKFHFDIRGGYYKNGKSSSSYFTANDIHRDYRSTLLSKEFRLPAYTHMINYPLYGPRNESDKDFYYMHTVNNPEISMVSISIKINELHYVYEGDESILFLNLRPTVYAIIAYIIAGKIFDALLGLVIPDPQADANSTTGVAFPCGGPVQSFGMGAGINPPAMSGAAEVAATKITQTLISSALNLMGALVGFAIASKFPCSGGDMGFLCIKMGSMIKNSGEIWPAKIKFRIEYGVEGQALTTSDLTIQGCATSPYVKDIFLSGFSELDPKNGNNYRNRIIKIYRITREMDPLSGGITEARYKIGAELFSVNEFVSGYFSYPNSAVIGTRVNSKDMPNIPRREYLIKGKLVKVPSAYLPEFGTHESTWNGVFRPKIQWTSNPAWIIYDLLINPVYGMGKYGIKEEDIDKWSFWKFSKRCDEPVSVAIEGVSTQERRFMCNLYINSQKPAYDLIKELMNLYGATINFSGGKVYISFDSPGDDNDAGGSIMLFNNSNVTEAGFSYSTTPQTSRITACTVDYLDERDNYEMKSEYYEDLEGIKEHGYKSIKIAGVAITRRGEANRLALSKVHSRQLEKEVINFSTGLQGSYLRIGDIIEVADNNKMSHQSGGRIMKVEEDAQSLRTQIHIDIPVSALPPEINEIYIQDINESFTPDTDSEEEPEHNRQYEIFQIENRNGFILTLNRAVSSYVRSGFVWLIKSGKDSNEDDIGSKQFTVKSVKEVKAGTEYEIMALEHSKIKYEIIDGGATVELDDAKYNEHEVVATDTFSDII